MLPVKHGAIAWNPATQEWFCLKCGKASDHLGEQDARAELEVFNCDSSVEMPKAIEKL
jgi:hypothetical protein